MSPSAETTETPLTLANIRARVPMFYQTRAAPALALTDSAASALELVIFLPSLLDDELTVHEALRAQPVVAAAQRRRHVHPPLDHAVRAVIAPDAFIEITRFDATTRHSDVYLVAIVDPDVQAATPRERSSFTTHTAV